MNKEIKYEEVVEWFKENLGLMPYLAKEKAQEFCEEFGIEIINPE
jgi:hypothetical protein